MRIIILSPSIYLKGGVERFSLLLADGLRSKGCEVSVLGFESLSTFSRLLVRFSRYIGTAPVVLGFFLGIQARKVKSDMIVTNGLLGWNISHLKTINVSHGTYARSAERIDKHKSFIKFFIKRYVWGYFEKINANKANVLVAVSQETKKSLIDLYGVTESIVIKNGVDTDFFCPNPQIMKNPLQGVFVGRYEYAKGIEVLKKVKEFLQKQGGDLRIVENSSQEDLLKVYQESSFFILPSLHEGCSFALLEAMACGLPVFTTPVGLAVDDTFPFKSFTATSSEDFMVLLEDFLRKDVSFKENQSIVAREYVLSNNKIEDCVAKYYQVIKTLL